MGVAGVPAEVGRGEGVRPADWVSKAEAVWAAMVCTASKVGVDVAGVGDGVEAMICVTIASAVWLAAVRTSSGLSVGEAVALEPQPTKTRDMANKANIYRNTFLFIIFLNYVEHKLNALEFSYPVFISTNHMYKQ
jgi:hypothetical protein